MNATTALRVLSIDIGGTGLKAAIVSVDCQCLSERVRVPTPYPCPPEVMLDALEALCRPLGDFDCISIGFPGVVRNQSVLTAPHFGTPEWRGVELGKRLAQRFEQRPSRLINDAEMQGLAAISGSGLELVLTLGTGAGTALFRNGELMPHLELAHHPIRGRKTYNDYVGEAARKKLSRRRWNKRVRRVIDVLTSLLNYDTLYIGGGNAQRIDGPLPDSVKIISNDAGVEGGGALWRGGIESPVFASDTRKSVTTRAREADHSGRQATRKTAAGAKTAAKTAAAKRGAPKKS